MWRILSTRLLLHATHYIIIIWTTIKVCSELLLTLLKLLGLKLLLIFTIHLKIMLQYCDKCINIVLVLRFWLSNDDQTISLPKLKLLFCRCLHFKETQSAKPTLWSLDDQIRTDSYESMQFRFFIILCKMCQTHLCKLVLPPKEKNPNLDLKPRAVSRVFGLCLFNIQSACFYCLLGSV